MMLSRTHHYYSQVYKQQMQLAKEETSTTTAVDHQQEEIHPLKAIGKFFFQSFWFDQGDSKLGADSWPEDIRFRMEDLVRLVETLGYNYDETLLEVYTELIIKHDEQVVFKEDSLVVQPVQTRVNELMLLLENVCEIILQGYEHKMIKLLTQYLINQLLVHLDEVRDFSTIVKSISLLNNTIVKRAVDSTQMMQLINDAIYFKFQQSQQPPAKDSLDKYDILRIL